ncbi:hypothetical protein DIPPA_21928 [Diplonema papillatum]|nr:hypothetical protein DIPPA_21928 [Diplonema papillatum]
MGAALMNPLLLAALALVVNGLALAWRWFKDVPWLEAQGSVQSPGVLSVPCLFLLQGTSFVAAQLLFFPKSTAFGVLAGGTVLAACVASPILLYYYVVRQVPFDVAYVPDPRVTIATTDCATANESESSDEDEDIKKLTGWKRRVYLFVFGDTVAVSIVESSFYAERWSHICDSYRPKYAVFACLEAGHMIVISLLSAWRPSGSGECNARNFILCLVLFVYAAALLYYRPLKAPMDNLLASFVSVMIFVSMLVMAIGVAVQAEAESILFLGAAYALLATAVIAFLKGIWDVGLYLYDLYIERRSQVRALNKKDVGAPSKGDSHDGSRTVLLKSEASDEFVPDNYVNCISSGNVDSINPLTARSRSDASDPLVQGALLRVRMINRHPAISSPTTPLSPSTTFTKDPRFYPLSDSDNESESTPLSRRLLMQRSSAPRNGSMPPSGYFSPVYADQLDFTDIDVSGSRSYYSLPGQRDQLSSRSLRSPLRM